MLKFSISFARWTGVAFSKCTTLKLMFISAFSYLLRSKCYFATFIQDFCILS